MNQDYAGSLPVVGIDPGSIKSKLSFENRKMCHKTLRSSSSPIRLEYLGLRAGLATPNSEIHHVFWPTTLDLICDNVISNLGQKSWLIEYQELHLAITQPSTVVFHLDLR